MSIQQDPEANVLGRFKQTRCWVHIITLPTPSQRHTARHHEKIHLCQPRAFLERLRNQQSSTEQSRVQNPNPKIEGTMENSVRLRERERERERLYGRGTVSNETRWTGSEATEFHDPLKCLSQGKAARQTTGEFEKMADSSGPAETRPDETRGDETRWPRPWLAWKSDAKTWSQYSSTSSCLENQLVLLPWLEKLRPTR